MSQLTKPEKVTYSSPSKSSSQLSVGNDGQPQSNKKIKGPTSPSEKSSKNEKNGSETSSPTKNDRFSANAFNRSIKFKKAGATTKSGGAAAAAAIRGLKLDPSEWTNREVISKFCVFGKFIAPDRSKNIGGEIIIDTKKLIDDDILVIREILMRVTEIQNINIFNSMFNDVGFKLIMDGMVKLRHLKKLVMNQNMLTNVSVENFANMFMQNQRKVEVLDFRGNQLSYEDGYRLAECFPLLQELNGVPVASLVRSRESMKIELINQFLREPEMGVLSFVIQDLTRRVIKITELNISRNIINSRALKLFVADMTNLPTLTHIDLSYNPLTNDSTNFEGVESLCYYANQKTKLRKISLEGVSGIPAKVLANLLRSTQVNRAVAGKNDFEHFAKWARKEVEAIGSRLYKDPPAPEVLDIHLVDVDYVKQNDVRLTNVEVKFNQIKIKQGIKQQEPKPTPF